MNQYRVLRELLGQEEMFAEYTTLIHEDVQACYMFATSMLSSVNKYLEVMPSGE